LKKITELEDGFNEEQVERMISKMGEEGDEIVYADLLKCFVEGNQ